MCYSELEMGWGDRAGSSWRACLYCRRKPWTPQVFFAFAVSRKSLLSFLPRSLDQNLSDFLLIFLEIMKQVQGIDHNPISFVDISEPEERKTFKIKNKWESSKKDVFWELSFVGHRLWHGALSSESMLYKHLLMTLSLDVGISTKIRKGLRKMSHQDKCQF